MYAVIAAGVAALTLLSAAANTDVDLQAAAGSDLSESRPRGGDNQTARTCRLCV